MNSRRDRSKSLAKSGVREKAELELSRQAEIMRLSFDAIIIWRLEGGIESWNRGAEELYGFAQDEALGQRIHDLLRTVFPISLAEIEAALEAAGEWEGELQHRTKNGRQVVVLARLQLIRSEDGARRVLEINRDITERKRAEEAVKQSHRTLAELVERCPFGIYIVDSQFRISHMNPSSQAGAFRNVRPVIGRPFDEAMRTLWPEQVAADIIGHFRHTLETGEPFYSPPFFNPRHDVEIVEAYEWELHRMTLPDGQYGVICYYFDSTRLRTTEAALRESEERLRLAQQVARIGSFEWDLEKKVTRWSSELEAVYGLPPGTIGGRYEEWASRVYPDDLPQVERRIRESLETGAFEMEWRIMWPDGTLRWLAARGQVFKDDAGKPRRMVGVNLDITERKQAEERLQLSEETLSKIFRVSAAAMILSRLEDGRILEVNDRWLEMMECTRDEVVGKTAAEHGCWKNPAERQAMLRALEERGCVRDFECVARPKSGRERTVMFSAQPVTIHGERVVVSSAVDITERKQVEATLRASRDRLQRVLEVEAVGVMFWDLTTGCLMDANDTFLRMMGYTRADIEAQELTWEKFTPPEYHEISRAEIRKFQETGRVGPYEKEYFRKDGTRQCLLFSGSSLGGNQCVEFCVDISDRKRAEAELAAAHRQTQSLIDNTTSIVYAFDLDERFILANAAVGRVLNTTAEQLLGKRRHAFMPKEDADWHEANDRKVIEEGTALEFEEHSELAERSITWLTTKFPLRDATGKIYAVGGISADISERKQAEAALRASEELNRNTLQALPAHIAVLDPAGRIIATNQCWEEFAVQNGAAGEASVMVGANYLAVCRRATSCQDESAAQALAGLEAVLAGRQTQFTLEYPCHSPREQRWFYMTVVPLGAPGNSGAVVTHLNITARRQAEEELKAALHEKEVLLKEVHHRVKNNMQVLSSLVNLQADGIGDPAAREVFSDFRDQVRAMALVHENLYRSESLAFIDFAEYTRGLTTSLARAHRHAECEIRLAVDAEPVSLPIESAVPCGLILNELVTNAYKHAFRGRSSGQIVVTLRKDSGAQVCLGVCDNGVGLPPGIDQRRPSSLGLHLVELLAGQLHGQFEFATENGTAFRLAFMPAEPKPGKAETHV